MLLGITLALCSFASLASAVDCREEAHQSNRYTVCEVDAGSEDLRLFLKDDAGQILGQFDAIEAFLPDGQSLRFAMNAGMYHPNRTPVGYYIAEGNQEQRLFTKASPGNFGLLPNGVFCIREARADVIETLRFAAEQPDCTYATQSGPMLVIDDALHPRFLPDSTSAFVRNGVGTSTDGQRVVFVKSENSVTFHAFGSFFKDRLKLPQALYFDGKVSRLHAPQIGRSDPGFWLGPIVGVVSDAGGD
ncbi:phosphodiester glycosidase family protein [Cognatishimia sp. SS12]|uniref:phosphodiester glycosidase family protein n=1 Tax=Cognatishimia sp. SS12 TaxID=2979465 RepID=UPI00232E6B1C|nr:phosphodiester glycosidase family protein [Cognatishimia sp. SS12]MDC0737959.1 phosphodiester glycosidase family protein [Cognatishimia sp. SS12]